MGERVLTVRDRIVVHLSAFNRFADEFECPEDMCQSGISEATGKSRAHITLELNRMKEAGLVTDRNAHIKGAKSKRKTYFLTPMGLARSAEINGLLESLKIEIIESGKSQVLSALETSEYLRSNHRLSRVMAVDRVLASGGILSLEAKDAGLRGANNIHLPQKTENFQPRMEMDALLEAVNAGKPEIVALLGIPGIGKTALLSELAWSLEADMPVFYKCIYPFDTVRSVMSSVGDFLEGVGYSALLRYLKNTQPLDLPEAGIHLAKCLREKRLILIFDDLDRGSAALGLAFSMMAETVRGSGSVLLVASSKRPDFYSIKSKSLDKGVCEILVKPLDDERSQGILGPENATSRDNVKIAGGHPLSLKLLAAGMTRSNLVGFVEDEVLGKDSGLSELCRFASVLRKPFSPNELEALGTGAAKDVRGNLVFERRDYGYVLHPAISSIMQNTASEKMLNNLHRKAVQLYEREPGDIAEMLYHLLEAGEVQIARKMVIERGENILSKGNPEDIALTLESMQKKYDGTDYELMDITAKAMNLAGNWTSASKLARKIEKEAAGTPWAMSAKLLRANILAKTGKPKDALILLGDVLESAHHQGNPMMAEAHYSAASVLRKLGRNPAALEEVEIAIRLSTKIGDELLLARSIMENAMIVSVEGRHAEALEKLEMAIAYFEGMGNISDVIRCNINKGMIFRAMGRDDEAVAALEKSVKLAEDSGLSRFKAHALANLTDLLNQAGEFQRSAELAIEAHDIFSGLGEPMMQAASMMNLGSALAGSGKRKDAINALEGAVALLEKNDLAEARTHWLIECADILRGMGEKERAAAVLAKVKKNKS